MMEAFSKAREYWEVGLCVNASNLGYCQQLVRPVGEKVSVVGASAPGEGDLDVLFVDREAQVEQLKLAVVSVEEIPPGSAILACTSHVLAEAIQRGALLGISLWVVAVGVLYVVFQGVYPIDLVGSLERHGDHGDLGHDGAALPARSWMLSLRGAGAEAGSTVD